MISLAVENSTRAIAVPKDLPESLSASSRLLRFTVSDNGPGIAPQHIPHLFEPFYRADAARSHNDHHLGLGLSMVRTYARNLGGDCRISSQHIPGATFVVELPMLVFTTNAADSSLSGTRDSSPLSVATKDSL